MFSRSTLRFLVCLALLIGAVLSVVSCTSESPTPTTAPVQLTPSPITVNTPTPASTSSSLTIEGQWEGSIKVAGQNIGIIVRFKGNSGDLKAWLDIPTQSAKDVVLNQVSLNATKLHFEAFGGQRNAVFDGDFANDTINGKFTQAGYEGTFSLKRTAGSQVSPTAEVPYKQEEVTFTNGDVTLGGTLTTPRTGSPFPAVVLISGSGQQNRDEEIYGFKPFALLADSLTRNGIAVLRYDDRGIGASTGDTANATSADFANDVLAAVNLLKTRSDINPKQIGLLGHSEGGIIAPMVATQSQDVAFIVMLAGPGVRGDLLLERQVVDVLRAGGSSQADIDKALANQKRNIEAIKTGNGLSEIEAETRAQVRQQIEAMSEQQRKALGDIDKAVEEAVQTQMAQLQNPWLKFFVSYDPAPALEKVQVPVLALFGGKDVQVAAEPNEQAIRAALDRGQNTHATFKTYPSANHLFQSATTGAPSEYATLKDFVPGLLDDVTKWIKDNCGVK